MNEPEVLVTVIELFLFVLFKEFCLYRLCTAFNEKFSKGAPKI